MDGRKEGIWIDGWMDGWKEKRWIERKKDEWIDGRVIERKKEIKKVRTEDGWMDGWTNGQTESILVPFNVNLGEIKFLQT